MAGMEKLKLLRNLRIAVTFLVMADNKKSFILYCDLIHTVSKMPDDKAGELFKHILKYVNDENPVTDDLIIQLTFEPIKQQLKRDLSAWNNEREQRRLAGKKGMEARWGKKDNTVITKDNTVITKDNAVIPAITKITDNVTVTVNDNVTANVKKDIYKSKREFYEKEISENSDKEQIEGYKNMVKYIFGENPIKVPLDKILKATHQLSYESFVELVEIQSKSTKKLRDLLLGINGHDKQYTILFSALKNWFK